MVSDMEKIMKELISIKREIKEIRKLLPDRLTVKEQKLLEESYSHKLLGSKEVRKQLGL